MPQSNFDPIRFIVVLFMLLSLGACSSLNLKKTMENQKPKVSVADQRITHIDFESIGLAFGLQVDNPNPIGISLAGLDYDLKLDGKSFVTGQQDKHMRIGASGASRIELPLSMRFEEIYQGLRQLKDSDEVPYELTTGLLIDVPLLGKMRYPVTTRGRIPTPHMPKISLKSMQVEKLGFNGATLALALEMDNPNAFGLGLNRLQYDLKINGKPWFSGQRKNLGTIQKNGKSVITLPVTLNFSEMGSGLYQLLNSGQAFDYQLDGKLDAHSDHKLIGKIDLPINSTGRIKLSR